MNINLVWYVDDILILGSSQEEVMAQAVYIINLLTTLGVHINLDKSMKTPSQVVKYLGQVINLKDKYIQHQQHKLDKAINLTKNLYKGNTTIPKQLAALADYLWICRKAWPTFMAWQSA